MQREMLYNLVIKAYLNCVLFVFTKKQNSVRPIFVVAKKSFFSTPIIDLIFSSSNTFYL